MEHPATTDELLARWREAERALVYLAPGSAEWARMRSLADVAWAAYERRLDDERREAAKESDEP